MEPVFVKSERGNELLILDGGKFTFKKVLKNNESFWRCPIKTCKAKVWTVGPEKIVSRSELQHSHTKNSKLLNRQLVSNIAKRKATEDLTEKPSKIIYTVLKENITTVDTLTMRDVNYIRNNIYYKRRKIQPPLPKSANEIIEPLEGTANVGKQQIRIKKYVCDYENCKAEFSRPWRLASHKCTHTGERPYPCTESGCNKAYTNPSHLKRHVRTAHTAKPFVANLKCTYAGCTDTLQTIQNLKKHIKRRHEVYQCQHCEEKFTRNWKLKEHMFEHTGVCAFTCTVCNKSFRMSKELKKHERHHRLYRCKVPDCNEVFKFWTHYRKHMILKHKPDYVCECCGRSFYSGERLQFHMKTVHCSDEAVTNKWKCHRDGCNRVFKHKRNLTQHVRHLHEGNCFVCPVEGCGKYLLWKMTYDKHIRLHDANRPLPRPRKKRRKRKDTGIPKKSCASILSNIALPVEADKALIQKDTMDREELSTGEAMEEESEENGRSRPEIEHINIKSEYTVSSDVEESSNVEDYSDFEVVYRNVDRDGFIEDSGATSDSSCNTHTVLTKY